MSGVVAEFSAWLETRYRDSLGSEALNGVRFRPIDPKAISQSPSEGGAGLLIQDAEIGWIFFALPYQADLLQIQLSQAIGIRSRLLRESNYTGSQTPSAKEDKDGSWRVGIVWLVGSDEWEEWQRAVLAIRRESGAVEELSVDAIKIEHEAVRESFESHGFARLLLQTRALLKKSFQDVEEWGSADAQVVGAIRGFSERFEIGRAREMAAQLELVAASFTQSRRSELPNYQRLLNRFRVSNFRNLESFDLACSLDGDATSGAVILCGPNGTGKSSLAEAISLAAFGNSPRLEQYLSDSDVRAANPQQYVRDYVHPIDRAAGAANQQPLYSWNDDARVPFSFDARGSLDGVVMSQEDSTDFTRYSKEELATHVLKGYSGVADSVAAWVAGEERRAADAKNAFTRKYGINSAVRLSSTAYSRLAEQVLASQLPRLAPEFYEWLRFIEEQPLPEALEATGLSLDWRTYGDPALLRRQSEAIARLMINDTPASIGVVDLIRSALIRHGNLAVRSGQLRAGLEKRTSELRATLDLALEQLDLWGAWLEKQLGQPAARLEGHVSVVEELESLAESRSKIEAEGRHLRSRIELLDRAKTFVSGHWNEAHPEACPVCDSDVGMRGGIELVVESLQAETNGRITNLRERFLDIQRRQKEIELRLKADGASVCPVTEDDRAALSKLLDPFLPQGESLAAAISDQRRRAQLKSTLGRLRSIPPAPEGCADVDREAERLASEISALKIEADRALEDPQAIADVKKRFEFVMERVLAVHLPETLGAVWGELTLALTPASWLLPELPKLHLEQRGKKLSVRAGDSNLLARYIFNAAERHVLSLAWFFTSYVSRRRFGEGWMLLDDPASDMDQPSYREFIRFLETVLRLNRRAKTNLTVILSLHQEDRALDAARATNGQIYLLGWRRDQTDQGERASVQRVTLLAPGFYPMTPEAVLGG